MDASPDSPASPADAPLGMSRRRTCRIHQETGSTDFVYFCCMRRLEAAVETGDDQLILAEVKDMMRGSRGYRFPSDADYAEIEAENERARAAAGMETPS